MARYYADRRGYHASVGKCFGNPHLLVVDSGGGIIANKSFSRTRAARKAMGSYSTMWGREKVSASPLRPGGKYVCAFSKGPLCDHCSGAMYKCDILKNSKCRSFDCSNCGFTSNPIVAKSKIPFCRRRLPNRKSDFFNAKIHCLKIAVSVIAIAQIIIAIALSAKG